MDFGGAPVEGGGQVKLGGRRQSGYACARRATNLGITGNRALSSTNHGVREILRALAEARDGPFYNLWLDVQVRIRSPLPDIGFRIYQSDAIDAQVSVWVSAVRSDGNQVCWGVGVETRGDEFEVFGEISEDDDRGSHEVFWVSDRSTDLKRAAEMIGDFARQVCARRECLETPGATDSLTD